MTMAELINRKEIFFTYSKKDKEEYGGDFAGGVLFALDKIDEMPTIEAKPVVHAHWECDSAIDPYCCSNCGKKALQDYFEEDVLSKYCPYCGALMDEKEK
jgi:DNA-directed RNA polymerase subunit RPC12/RpoP